MKIYQGESYRIRWWDPWPAWAPRIGRESRTEGYYWLLCGMRERLLIDRFHGLLFREDPVIALEWMLFWMILERRWWAILPDFLIFMSGKTRLSGLSHKAARPVILEAALSSVPLIAWVRHNCSYNDLIQCNPFATPSKLILWSQSCLPSCLPQPFKTVQFPPF